MKKLSDTEIVSAASIGAGKKRTGNNKKYLPRLIAVFTVLVMAMTAIPMLFSDTDTADGADGDTGSMGVIDKYDFGGNQTDWFYDVVEASDGGYVAVGYSSFSSTGGTSDWDGYTTKGGVSDAIIVKFNTDGTVAWKNNFGGKDSDRFFGVTETSGGYVAVGYSSLGSFNDGDWETVTAKGGSDAIIVKFNTDGTVAWKNNFGGNGNDHFYGVTVADGGFVAVGQSFVNYAGSTGDKDWSGNIGKGGSWDATLVKFDDNGNTGWRYNFGGNGDDYFKDVAEVAGEYVAVGYSTSVSFDTGDWSDVTAKGNDDAILVKFNTDGTVVWKYNFGGIGNDHFYSVTAAEGGFVTAGQSDTSSFGTVDWQEVESKGGLSDATLIKFDINGTVAWENNFGGSRKDYFYGVTAAEGGFVAVGYSEIGSFGSSDWVGHVSKMGGVNATIVKFNDLGSAVSKYNFGGGGGDQFLSVIEVSDGEYVAVGYSLFLSTGGTNDWSGYPSKDNVNGTYDAIAVRMGPVYDVIYHTSGGNSDGPQNDTVGQRRMHTLNSTDIPTHSDVNGTKVIFAGWSETETVSIADKDDTLPQTIITSLAVGNANMTVYAVWAYDSNDNEIADVNETEYTVRYETNDGTGASHDASGLLSGMYALDTETAPARMGYIFKGWSRTAAPPVNKVGSLPEDMVTSMNITGDMTFYAVWAEDSNNNGAADYTEMKYKVTYDANGGSDEPAEEMNLISGMHALSTAEPSRSGYVFMGWLSDPVFSVGKDDIVPETVVSVNITLSDILVYAVWAYDSNNNEIADVSETKYIVTYSVNGGNADGPQDDTMLIEETNNVLNSTDIPTHPDVNGKKVLFAGWSETETAYIIDMSGTLPHMETSVEIENDDVTVYAVWAYDSNDNQIPDVDETKYTVRYEMNDGTGGSQDASGLFGMYALDAAVPARSGYIFMGWSETETADTGKYGSIPSTVGSVTITSSDIAVYAVWAEDLNNNETPDANETKYTVTYDMNDGAGGPANEDGVLSGTYSLNTAVPVRPGYVFMGWSETKAAPLNDSGSLPADMVTSMNITGNAVVYAVWVIGSPAPGDATGGMDTENGGWVFPWYLLLIILIAISAAGLMISYRIRKDADEAP